jgi:hypothetical protein
MEADLPSGFLSFICFLVEQSLNSGYRTCKAHLYCLSHARLYCLSHTSSPFCSGYFGDGISRTICPGWTQNSHPPDLRCETMAPGSASFFKMSSFQKYLKPRMRDYKIVKL